MKRHAVNVIRIIWTLLWSLPLNEFKVLYKMPTYKMEYNIGSDFFSVHCTAGPVMSRARIKEGGQVGHLCEVQNFGRTVKKLIFKIDNIL